MDLEQAIIVIQAWRNQMDTLATDLEVVWSKDVTVHFRDKVAAYDRVLELLESIDEDTLIEETFNEAYSLGYGEGFSAGYDAPHFLTTGEQINVPPPNPYLVGTLDDLTPQARGIMLGIGTYENVEPTTEI